MKDHNNSEILIYQSENGMTKIDVKIIDETVWLTQAQLCELYQTSKSNVSEHIKHIFEPLYCVDKSRSRELGGSGLGLAIVRNICKTLGYKVEVYSKIGYGTEFVIKL